MAIPSPADLLAAKSPSEPGVSGDSDTPATSSQPERWGREGPPRIARRKKKRTGLIASIVVVIIVAVAVVAVLLSSSATKDGVPVLTEAVASRHIIQTVTATGIVDPETQVKISSEVSGEIITLAVKEGDHVRKGTLLVRINPESIAAQADEADAAISGARARESQSRASLLRSQRDYDRAIQLFERKLVTQQDLDAARASVDIAKAELDGARYSTEQARAGLRRVRESLARTSIYAPINGVVTKLNSKVGEKVVGAIQMTGTEIMTIADLTEIEAVVDVSETDVVDVKMGDTAEVEVDAIPNQKFVAFVSRIANSPKQSGVGQQDQVTNFEVRVRFAHPDARLRPGMTSTATIRVASRPNVLSVPIQSVTTRDTTQEEEPDDATLARNRQVEKAVESRVERPQPVVFVRRGDSVYMTPVETGVRDNEYIEITSGLNRGELVVTGSYKAITKDLEDRTLVVDMPRETRGARGKEKD